MKINFLKIKKNYTKKSFKISPNFYWKIIVSIFFLLLVASFLFSWFVFKKTNIQNELVFERKSEKLSDKEKKKIQEALNYFSEREKKTSEILNSEISVVDPAL